MADKLKKIAGKTDSAVKTTESWFSFGNILMTAWGVIGAFATTAVVQVWRSALNVGWEYWVLSAVVVMPLTMLGLSWMWHLRPLSKKDSHADSSAPDKDVRAVGVVETSQMSDIEVRLSEIERYIKSDVPHEAVRAFVVKKIDVLTRNVAGFESRMDKRFEEFKTESYRSLDALHQSRKASDAIKFGQLAEIQDARIALEFQSALSSDIDLIHEQLDQDKVHEDFEVLYETWRGKVSSWLEGVQRHVSFDLSDPFNYDTLLLKKGRWQDWVNSIDDPDMQLMVKEFSIQSKEFIKIREHAIGHLKANAFSAFHGHGANEKFVSRFRD